MIIDKAEVIVTSPDRNFVTLKVTIPHRVRGRGTNRPATALQP